MKMQSTYRLPRLMRCLVAALAVTAWSAGAWAQDNVTSFQVEQFEPLPSQGLNTLGVGGSKVLNHLTPSAGLFFHYVKDPIQLVPVNGSVDDPGGARLIADQLKVEVLASIGLFGFLELGVALPFVAYQTGDDLASLGRPGETVNSFSLADFRIIPKVQIIDPHKDWAKGFGLAFMLPLYIPVGDADSFQSDGNFRLEPRLVVDWNHSSGFGVGANVGYQLLRSEVVAQNYANGDTFRWGSYLRSPKLGEHIQIIGSLFGASTFEDARQIGGLSAEDLNKGNPIEAQLALQALLPANFVAQVGAGTGLNNSIGSPALRVFASIGYTPMSGDRDGDGILDADDDCPDVPGVIEYRGCPVPDQDGDGIPDDKDQCPAEPEDFDGFQDEDGCPDPDNDQDGILDTEDKCPNEPGVIEYQGCPIPDKDGDGIPDDKDKCPDVPGVPEYEGCPIPDRDKDGIPDDKDECPDDPGLPQFNGCPDRDGDGIPDHLDKCPDEPETYNGIKDDDGCPDGKETVVITETEIKILQKVFFDTGKDTIKKQSFQLLDTVAAVLVKNKQITKIRVEGHTDDVGKDDMNLDLSKRRARSVMNYLIGKGVPEERLSSEGFGEEKPLCADIPELIKTKALERKNKKAVEACRSDNRRVEFRIVEVNGKRINATDSVTIEKKTSVPEQ